MNAQMTRVLDALMIAVNDLLCSIVNCETTIYSQHSLNGHLYEKGSSFRRTRCVGPYRISVILLCLNSILDGHLSKTENGDFEIVNEHLKSGF